MSVSPGRLLMSRREALIDSITRALCAAEVRPRVMAEVRALRPLIERLVAAFLASLHGAPRALVDLVDTIGEEVPPSQLEVLVGALELLDELASDLAMTTLNLDRADHDLQSVSRAIRPARNELARLLCANGKKTTDRAALRSIS
jgi:hypothetical protein